MSKSRKPSPAASMSGPGPGVDRRDFLKQAAVGAAALVAIPGAVQAQPSAPAQAAGTAPPLSSLAKEAETGTPQPAEVLTVDRTGSDFMVDVIKSLGIEYICANPGSTFRGLHESVINYGGNSKPEFITCCHEESAVGMAHGYAKIEGKPIGVLLHSTVGLQHASMAIFNAFCDRVPVYLIAGNTIDVPQRRPGVEWDHSAVDLAAMVRNFVKWDDLPISLAHFAESAVRAYKIAMTPPRMPVLIVADSELQEHEISKDADLRVPRLTMPSAPQGDSGSVAEAARLLVAAENPVLVVDRAARTADGMKLIAQLAETLQIAVVDQSGRMNFSSRHPLNQTERAATVIANADLVMGLEVADLWGMLHAYRDQQERTSKPNTKPGTKIITITTGDLFSNSNYQDAQRYNEVDLAMAADAEATLPALIEAVQHQITSNRKIAFEERGRKLAVAHQRALDQARTEATYAWDASPISTARLSAELWEQIRTEDWSLVSDISPWMSKWPMRLWSFEKYYHFIGGAGGYGVGYGAPAAAGAALANRKYGRLSVNIQPDGDLMYGPGVLWTAAHHHIPVLNIMHNNRAYHQEVMHVQRMANRHSRGVDHAGIGTTIGNPNIDFAKLAQSMGVFSVGPITDPKDLAPAIRQAIAVVKRGEPALVDVVTQPR